MSDASARGRWDRSPYLSGRRRLARRRSMDRSQELRLRGPNGVGPCPDPETCRTLTSSCWPAAPGATLGSASALPIRPGASGDIWVLGMAVDVIPKQRARGSCVPLKCWRPVAIGGERKGSANVPTHLARSFSDDSVHRRGVADQTQRCPVLRRQKDGPADIWGSRRTVHSVPGERPIR